MSGTSLAVCPAHSSNWLGLTLRPSKQAGHDGGTAAFSQIFPSPKLVTADPADSSCPARTSVTGTWHFPTLHLTSHNKHGSRHWPWPSVTWRSQPSLALSKQCPGMFWASTDAADLFPWAAWIGAGSQGEDLWQQESRLAVGWVSQ